MAKNKSYDEDFKKKIVELYENKNEHNVKLLCKVLKVPRSVYYYHKQERPNSYDENNKELDKLILEKYNESNGCR